MLRVTEIYKSIQGESSFFGFPCTFIRLTGCSLRCRWCDTVYSFQGGRNLSIAEVVAEVETLGLRLVELTGGEPLEQADANELMVALLAKGYQVLLETSGAVSIEQVPAGVHVIMDIKCPDSRMHERNRFENLQFLKRSDEIKFVIASRADYEWTKAMLESHHLPQVCNILLSPAFGLMKNQDLAEWIIADQLPVRMQLQMHKYIWHPKAKGV